MYKFILVFGLLFVFIILFCAMGGGCSNKKVICLDEGLDCHTFVPYGLFNMKKENPNIEYDVSVGNVILSIIFCETVAIPVILVGWYLWEPVGTKVNNLGKIPGAID